MISEPCPIRTFKIANCKEPWLNNDLHEKLRDKDYFLKRAKHTNCPDDWNIAKYLRNQTKILIRKAKSDYFKDKLYSNRNNSKKFWKLISEVLPSKNKNSSDIHLIDQDSSEPITNTSEYINGYFANIGPNLAHNLNRPWEYLPSALPSKFQLKQVYDEDVINIVKMIDEAKASTVENMLSKILKDTFACITPQITYLFNLSITSNKVPCHVMLRYMNDPSWGGTATAPVGGDDVTTTRGYT